MKDGTVTGVVEQSSYTRKEELEFIASMLPRRGRRAKPKGEKVGSNNLYGRQWEWIQKEAFLKGIDGSQLLRQIVQWHIDDVEASRTGPVATPEDDQAYEELVQETSSKPKPRRKSTNSNKRGK